MSERDPEIEKTIDAIRTTVEEAQQSAKDQLDVTSEIDRLFLIYQKGGVIDQGKTSDTLMVARSAKKLDLLQFRNIANQVKVIEKHFDKKRESAKYQAALWSLNSSKGSGWDLAAPPEFSPERNNNNEPIGDNSLPDVSEILPKSFSEGIPSPMATPLADMMRSQEANQSTISHVDRLESMVGKHGLQFPNFKSASYTGAEERDLDSYQYHKLDADLLEKNLSSDANFASKVRDIDPGLFSGSTNPLGQPKPNEDEARQWANAIRNLHESRVAKIAEKHGAQKSSPPFAETKAQAKNYTQDAIKSIQESKIWGTSVPQEGTPGAPGPIEAPPIQTPENRPDEASPVQTDENRAASSGKEGMSMLDWLQLGLDGIGTVEPTPFADLTNMVISLGRAAFDPKNSGNHLKNAGISLMSAGIPYLGDVAKLAKGYGKGGRSLGNSMSGLAGSKIGKTASGMFGGTNAGLGGSGGSGSPPPIVPASAFSSGDNDGGPIQSGSVTLASRMGTFGKMIESTIKAFQKLNEWVNRTADSGKAMLEGQREYGLYSGQASAGFLKYDARETKRTISEAQYLGGSVAGLAGSQSNLEDAQSKGNRNYNRLGNNIQSVLNELATSVKNVTNSLDPLNVALGLFYDAVDKNKPIDQESRNSVEEFLRGVNVENKPQMKLPAKAK